MRTPPLGKAASQTIKVYYHPRGSGPPGGQPATLGSSWSVGSTLPDLLQRRQINPPAGLLPATGPAGELPPPQGEQGLAVLAPGWPSKVQRDSSSPAPSGSPVLRTKQSISLSPGRQGPPRGRRYPGSWGHKSLSPGDPADPRVGGTRGFPQAALMLLSSNLSEVID